MTRVLALPLILGLLAASPALAQSANDSASPGANSAPAAASAAPAAQPPASPQPAAAPAAAPTPAVPAAPKRVAMRALLSSGYEIKAVTLVPQDVASRVAHALDLDAAMVTLQKGSTAATCYLSVEQFSTPGMLDIAWCIDHK